MSAPRYLVWYDDNPRIPFLTKIEQAVAAYNRRFRRAPNVVLVHAADITRHNEVTIRAVGHVQQHNFWVGYEAEERGCGQGQ